MGGGVWGRARVGVRAGGRVGGLVCVGRAGGRAEVGSPGPASAPSGCAQRGVGRVPPPPRGGRGCCWPACPPPLALCCPSQRGWWKQSDSAPLPHASCQHLEEDRRRLVSECLGQRPGTEAWVRLGEVRVHTLRSEAGSRPIRLLLLPFPFLWLSCSLQAGKLLVELAVHSRSPCRTHRVVTEMHTDRQTDRQTGLVTGAGGSCRKPHQQAVSVACCWPRCGSHRGGPPWAGGPPVWVGAGGSPAA